MTRLRENQQEKHKAMTRRRGSQQKKHKAMTILFGNQHAIHVQRHHPVQGVFLDLNDNTASMKSDTSGQSRLSPVAPVVHRTTVKDELEQGSGVVVPLVLARHALHVAQNFNDANTQNQKTMQAQLDSADN